MHGHITLTVMDGKLAGKEYSFNRSKKCLIGRAHDCEIRLPNELEYLTVSRHHCLLDLDPPAVRVRDLGSRNGTFVNGVPIGHGPSMDCVEEDYAPFAPLDLHHGDVLRVGDTKFWVTVYEPTPEARPWSPTINRPASLVEACLN